mgnify:FL=1
MLNPLRFLTAPLFLSLALSAGACSSDAVGSGPAADASPHDALAATGGACHYNDFRGNAVVCPASPIDAVVTCPSADGCNAAACIDDGKSQGGGTFSSSLKACGCTLDAALFAKRSSTFVGFGAYTADDGCTVCTCGKDTGGPFMDPSVTCDASACK